MPRTFKLEIVTPEALVFAEEVESLVVPAYEGYLGVLAGHAPLLCALTPGEVTIRQGGSSRRFASSGGFMEVTPTKTIILADAVEEPGKIDVERARKSAERAKERLKGGRRETDVDRAQAAFARSANRIRIAKRNGRE